MERRNTGRVLLLGLWFIAGLVTLDSATSCVRKKTADTTPLSVSPTPMPFGEIIADDVPVRNGPGNEYDVVGTCSRGDIVKIVGSEGVWYKAHSDRFGGDVWIYTKFVQVSSLPGLPTPEKTYEPTQISLPSLTPVPSEAILTSPPMMTSSPMPAIKTTAIPCDPPPATWVVYVVQSGDTLYSLACRTGTTVEALSKANCLPDVTIYVGQKLHVPRLPPTPTLPLPPTLPPTPLSLDMLTLPPPPTPTPTLPPAPTMTPTPTGTLAPTPTPVETPT